jgi:DNA-binding LytR/AlgR family response regulator
MTDVNGPVAPSDECCGEPFTAGFGQRAAARASLRVLSDTQPLASGTSARVAMKANGKILFIDAADIVAVEAQGNYVLLLRTSGSHMLRESISRIQQKLDLCGFVRIHRSVLVNAALVEEIRPRPTGEYVLRMRGGREFRVTRTYKKNLQLLAQLWVGMEGFNDE